MIKLTESNVYTFIQYDSPEEEQFLLEKLTFIKEAKSYARFKITQKTKLYSRRGSTIIVFKGLTSYLLGTIYDNGLGAMHVKSINRFEPPSEDERKEAIVDLRDYQVEAFDSAIKHSGGILWMATNAGKTEVAGAIMKAYPNKKFLYLVHRLELLEQTKKRMNESFDLDVGELSVNQMNTSSQIVIAMIQTVHSRIDQLGNYLMTVDGVIADEAQHFGAGMAKTIMSKCTSASFRLGLTGTVPDDLCQRLSIVQFVGDVVYRVTNKELIDENYSSNIKITIYEGNWHNTGVGQEVKRLVMMESVGWSSNLWHEACMIAVVKNTERNKAVDLVVKRLQDQGETGILVFVDYIEHGQILADLTGLPFVSGGSVDRTELFNQFRNGQIEGLISSPVLDEGIDVRLIHHIIFASGKKSKTKLLQRIGRGLRKEEGKCLVNVVDFYDRETPMLTRHTEERIKVYKEEGFEVEIKNIENS